MFGMVTFQGALVNMKRKEHDLNQTSMIMCKMLIFRGVYLFGLCFFSYSFSVFTAPNMVVVSHLPLQAVVACERVLKSRANTAKVTANEAVGW